MEDGRMFPLNTYKDIYCVRNKKEFRTLNTEERE